MSSPTKEASDQDEQSTVVKGILLLVSVTLVTEGSLVSPALPAIQEHFGTSAPILTRLLFTVTPLTIALSSPFSGIFADRIGRKPLLIGATVLVAVGGGIGFFLNSILQLIVARALLGIGIGGVNVAAAALITDYYSGSQREQLLGLQSAAIGFGGVVLVFLSGVLVEMSWNMPFLVFWGVLVFVPLVAWKLWEPVETEYSSALPRSVSDVQHTINQLPWRSLAVIYAVGFFVNVVFYLVIVQAPFYLTDQIGVSASQVGIALAVYTLFWGISSLLYGRIKGALDVYTITALIFALLGVGYAIVGWIASFAVIVAGLAVAGLGLGLYIPNLITWVSLITEPERRGRALGGLTAMFFLGQFTSPLFTQPLIQAYGFAMTFTISGGILVALMLVFGFVGRIRKSPSETETPV